ncbi:hypothetical protein Zm00014a_044232 [Zea mays]|uniref:Uncharacterized protein n=1 Tax=Zea mays TaxID=4577 RepID=A0A3L6G3Q8_MAIZE|nr:hypothetical protein Zm00014a_044232 [Zea mays]
MPFTPGPYSGVSTLALVARASAFGVGVVYGSIKLSILKTLVDAATIDFFYASLWNQYTELVLLLFQLWAWSQNLKRRKCMIITKDDRAATC